MLAKLWAAQIAAGNRTFADTPRLLRERVAAQLTQMGREELAHDD